jgi:hypothetical protein
MEAVSSTEQSQGGTPLQANLIALRSEAQSQQAIADLLAKQAEQQTQTVTPPSNPEGIGQNVDTYA